jgi:tetratricopeptide (TPR) repeat protein
MKPLSLFISSVTEEFGPLRQPMRDALTTRQVGIDIQEDFNASGTPTLDKLDDYVRACEVVVHFVGDMTGAPANDASLRLLRQRYPAMATDPAFAVLHPALADPPTATFSYTQWEAYLAAYHQKVLLVAVPAPGAVIARGAKYVQDATQQADQQAHLLRLKALGHYAEVPFTNLDNLMFQVVIGKVLDLLQAAGKPVRSAKPTNLPTGTLGALFQGRDEAMAKLGVCLKHPPTSGSGGGTAAAVIVGKAVHGLGGVGKTRLAIEYGWHHQEAFSALLFVGADTPADLNRNLAALCGALVLDLPEKDVQEDAAKVAAAKRWLLHNSGWLLILDNLDTEEARTAAETLLKELHGGHGHVVMTSRLSNWKPGLRALELDVLIEEDAANLLLALTDGRRIAAPDDAATALTIARELGQLPLALEQAGAYIAKRRVTLGTYFQRWQASHQALLEWFDQNLIDYPRSVAVTWQTSFAQLTPAAQLLLNRLAWLAPDPIPRTLLQVAIPEAEPLDVEAVEDAWADLVSYSLASVTGAQTFTVHRLVQDVTRQWLAKEVADIHLLEALRWVNAAFVGKAHDVDSWPVLDPLVSHALAVSGHPARIGDSEPTSRLLNQVAQLMYAKAQFGEAEPLMRRTLQIAEASYGLNHPIVAIGLNNLAALLQATNRLAEAEPLTRRALLITEDSYGSNHPTVATALNNLGQLLKATNRLAEAEPLMRRALQITEDSYGPNHPTVAIRLNNLALLLQDTNRLAEAEPLMRRALQITEDSYGPNHPEVATDLNNLASLLQATNRLAEAEPLMRRALRIDEDSFGSNHPEVARDLNNLGQLLKATNRLAEAEEPMRRALLIFFRSLGWEHPNTHNVINNFGTLLMKMGHTQEEAVAKIQALLAGDEA